MWNLISNRNKGPYIELAESELNNSRPATAKKAALFLKKCNIVPIL
jgi:hypothetical protein